MSHFTATNSIIKDVNILKECLRAKGLRVEVGVAIRGYQGQLSPTTYEIVGCHDELQQDIGYSLQKDGTYTAYFHSDTTVGQLMQQVAQAYAAKHSEEQANKTRGLLNARVNVLVHS